MAAGEGCGGVGVSLKMAEKTCEGLNVVGKDPGERE